MQDHNRWLQFYENIRDPSWPDCCNEHQFYKLPDHIQKEIIDQHDGQRYVQLLDSDVEFFDPELHQHNLYDTQPGSNYQKKFQVAPDFFVYYNNHLDGQGPTNGQDFANVIRYLYPGKKFRHCLDWCSGAGFIGFRVLADQLCDKVTLHDGFQPSIDACHFTIDHMPDQYRDRVFTVCSDNIDWIDSAVRFDLVIGNPPPRRHWLDFPMESHCENIDFHRLLVDPDWKCHHNFMKKIASKLSRDGAIIIKNPITWVSTQDYVPLLQESGLVMKKAFREKFNPWMWYIVIGFDEA
jgi:hypothetical protein